MPFHLQHHPRKNDKCCGHFLLARDDSCWLCNGHGFHFVTPCFVSAASVRASKKTSRNSHQALSKDTWISVERCTARGKTFSVWLSALLTEISNFSIFHCLLTPRLYHYLQLLTTYVQTINQRGFRKTTGPIDKISHTDRLSYQNICISLLLFLRISQINKILQ